MLQVQPDSTLLPSVNTGIWGIGIVWVIWRFWTFTVRPWLHPQEPKEVPYLLPYIGHLFAFFNDADSLIDYSRAYFKGSSEPFTLSVLGVRTYVLTHAQDVASAYQNTTTFSFDIFVQHLMRSCGTSESAIDAMFSFNGASGGFPNPKDLSLARLSRTLHIHQLFPGINFDDLCTKFIASFEKRLHWGSICQSAAHHDSKDDPQEQVLPLLAWVSDVVTLAGQDAYFGPSLGEVDREMHKTFLTFDGLGWQVLYQYPRILSRTMSTARDQLVASLESYLHIPQEKRNGDAWFVKAEENEMRARGISTHDIATMMLPIYWGINTNTRKLTFWLLAYILSKDGLMEAIREECEPGFDKDGQIDPEYIRKCTILNGAFYEAIRITAFSASVRYVSQDTEIGNKVLKTGSRLMIPYRQLHFDSSVFGEDIHAFNSNRFIANKSLLKSSKWRPFGGGNTMCPGRHIAKQVVCVFVAMLLHQYDIKRVKSQEIPKAETRKPVLGIMDVAEGTDDLLVSIMKRGNI